MNKETDIDCPRCGKKVEGKQTRFCKYCGQAVKWVADSDKTIDGFAFWIENEENGVCYVPLNLCEKIMKLLKEQEPKQVIGIADSIEGMEVGYCPSCNRGIVNKKNDETKFCKFCGQKVRWDD